ncbi:helix-turn-helix domain-containing protein [Chitinophaga rhizophila]|uniref:AraC family transcriptional regulator n=1 Tax=Chitinophaga rhizophila TaxID=2866212 RepID=A0ABS7GAS6_9BACT|nr:AraC family transcriptional regulator [Chitinophaga rhizophila]MBW8684776.1 AraC family transcriptional regulator [Chitinophaga rhizophila]
MNDAKEHIQLLELNSSAYGLVISPMLRSYSLLREVEVAFDPHRHDFYSLFLLESGSVVFNIDAQQVTMTPGSMLLICPGQVHQCLEASDIAGWVVSFDAKLLDLKARSWIEQLMPGMAFFSLSSGELSFFKSLLSLIYEAFQEAHPGKFHQQLLHSLVNSIFYKAANLHISQQADTKVTGFPRPVQIVQQFKQLVKTHFRSLKRPADYAGLMHLSVNYLNNTVKAITGFPATYFVQEETIGEAQRLILYTSKTVKEISSDLGFTDHKYFIRLFGKVAGISPTVFRKANHNKPAYFSNVLMIFKTDIPTQHAATTVIEDLLKLLPSHHIDFRLNDDTCLIQLEGRPVHTDIVLKALQVRNYTGKEISSAALSDKI